MIVNCEYSLVVTLVQERLQFTTEYVGCRVYCLVPAGIAPKIERLLVDFINKIIKSTSSTVKCYDTVAPHCSTVIGYST